MLLNVCIDDPPRRDFLSFKSHPNLNPVLPKNKIGRRMFVRKPFWRKVPTCEAKELTLDDLEGLAKKLKENKLSDLMKSVSSKLNEIASAREAVHAAVQALGSAEPTEEVYPKLYKMGDEARRHLFNKAMRALSAIEIPKHPTWQTLLDFRDSVLRAAGSTMEASAVHGRYAAIVFEKQTRDFIRSVKRFGELAASFNDFLQGWDQELQKLESISLLSQRRREILETLAGLRDQRELLEKEIGSLEQALAEGSSDLEHFLAHDLKQLQHLRREVEELERKVKEVENGISSTFSGLSRPFRKMKKVLMLEGHRLEGGTVKMLELYINDPLRAVLSEDDGLPILNLLLRELLGLIQGGKLGLEAREREKRLRQIQSLLSSGVLPKFQGEYRALLDEISTKKLEYERSTLHGRRAELEKSVQEKRAKLDLAREKLITIATRIDELERELRENAAEIERVSSEVLGVAVKLI